MITAIADWSICLALGLLRSEGGLWWIGLCVLGWIFVQYFIFFSRKRRSGGEVGVLPICIVWYDRLNLFRSILLL